MGMRRPHFRFTLREIFVCTLWAALSASAWTMTFDLYSSMLPELACSMVKAFGPLIAIGALWDETLVTLALGIAVAGLFLGHLAGI